MSAPPTLRREVVAYSQALHARGWVANHDGNVSVRVPGEAQLLITPTAISKRKVTTDGLVLTTFDGAPVGRGKPPSEVALHLGAYKARPDVRAVLHAHPPHASAFALARQPLAPVAMPEVVVSLGATIPLVPLALPKDPAAAAMVGEGLGEADAVLLAGNGVLTVGVDLEQAFLRLELVEHYARIVLLSRTLGGPAALADAEVARLLEQRRAAGLGPAAKSAAKSGPPKPLATSSDPVRSIVAEEVRRVLSGERK